MGRTGAAARTLEVFMGDEKVAEVENVSWTESDSNMVLVEPRGPGLGNKPVETTVTYYVGPPRPEPPQFNRHTRRARAALLRRFARSLKVLP